MVSFQPVVLEISAKVNWQILMLHEIPRGKGLIGNSFILRHDNDPKRTAEAVKSYLDRITHNGALSAMDWPPRIFIWFIERNHWLIPTLSTQEVAQSCLSNRIKWLISPWQPCPPETFSITLTWISPWKNTTCRLLLFSCSSGSGRRSSRSFTRLGRFPGTAGSLCSFCSGVPDSASRLAEACSPWSSEGDVVIALAAVIKVRPSTAARSASMDSKIRKWAGVFPHLRTRSMLLSVSITLSAGSAKPGHTALLYANNYNYTASTTAVRLTLRHLRNKRSRFTSLSQF